MPNRTLPFLRSLALGALLALGLAGAPALTSLANEKTIVGTVSMEEMEVALLASGSWGHGKLHYKGKTYDFNVSGLGVGGVGISTIDAYGYVYNMKSLEEFAGVYGEASTGVVAGTVSTGSLWLQNEKGVLLKLDASREGLALALGASGIVIQMSQ